MSDTTSPLKVWMEALDSIEAMLHDRLRHEAPLPTPPPVPSGAITEALTRVDERLASWHVGGEQADQLASEAAAETQETLAAFAAWQTDIARLRVILEAWSRRVA